jgi:hypothetical protein
MQEVNAAWRVLRSPADRAAYDDALRGTSVEHRDTTVAGHAGPSFADRLVELPRHDAAPFPPRPSGRWHRRVPLLIVAVLLVGGLVLAIAVSASRPSTSGDQPELRTGRYSPGSCVAVQPGPTAAVVSCDLPNSGRVAVTTDYPRPCPTGTETIALVEERVALCLVAP